MSTLEEQIIILEKDIANLSELAGLHSEKILALDKALGNTMYVLADHKKHFDMFQAQLTSLQNEGAPLH